MGGFVLATTRFGINHRKNPHQEVIRVGPPDRGPIKHHYTQPRHTEQSEEDINQALERAAEKRVRKANKRAMAIPRQEHHN